MKMIIFRVALMGVLTACTENASQTNAKDAAIWGQSLVDALTKLNEEYYTDAQKKLLEDVKSDIKENAEHVSVNAGKIAHQREHFDMFSKDMYALVKVVNPAQALDQDHCPM